MAGWNADDYVDVAERIRQFYGKYPDGRLTTGAPPQVVEIAGKPYVWYHARAYRSPDDTLPGDGWAAEPVPGPTQFTRDSELMNAETAAWGRAIAALGFATKKIASQEEVRNRQQFPIPEKAQQQQQSGPVSKEQLDRIADLIPRVAEAHDKTPDQVAGALKADYGSFTELTAQKAQELVGKLERWEKRAPKAAA